MRRSSGNGPIGGVHIVRAGDLIVDSIQVNDITNDSTISGTPKLLPVMDSGGNTYYIKIYPTKA